MRRVIKWTVKNVRRVLIAIIGFTVLAVGIVMIVTPGPAIIVIPLGLGILATEFVWAQRILQHVKQRIANMRKKEGASETNDSK